MKIILKLALIGLSAVIFFSGYGSSNDWQGFYYPGGDSYQSILSPQVASYAACKAWINGMESAREQAGQNIYYDEYECGYKCKGPSVNGLYTCKETKE